MLQPFISAICKDANSHSCRQARMLIVIHVGKQEMLISSMLEARMLIAIHISEKGCYSHSCRKARIANGHSYRQARMLMAIEGSKQEVLISRFITAS
eukprot:scaffold19420_cov212-Skeletonema_dohrnii-CCMP3373.AAC.1